MGPDDSISLTPELLNDFYAECEEHLNNIRSSLVELERGVEADERVVLIEKLFRSFHSLKGILGMAGIQSAEGGPQSISPKIVRFLSYSRWIPRKARRKNCRESFN